MFSVSLRLLAVADEVDPHTKTPQNNPNPNPAAHQKKVTARELGLLVKNKLVPEPPTTSVQQAKNTEGPQQEEKSEILTLLRALNERVAKLEGQEEKMKPPRPNKERKPPQYRERHQPYPPRRGRGRGRGRGGY